MKDTTSLSQEKSSEGFHETHLNVKLHIVIDISTFLRFSHSLKKKKEQGCVKIYFQSSYIVDIAWFIL